MSKSEDDAKVVKHWAEREGIRCVIYETGEVERRVHLDDQVCMTLDRAMAYIMGYRKGMTIGYGQGRRDKEKEMRHGAEVSSVQEVNGTAVESLWRGAC